MRTRMQSILILEAIDQLQPSRSTKSLVVIVLLNFIMRLGPRLEETNGLMSVSELTHTTTVPLTGKEKPRAIQSQKRYLPSLRRHRRPLARLERARGRERQCISRFQAHRSLCRHLKKTSTILSNLSTVYLAACITLKAASKRTNTTESSRAPSLQIDVPVLLLRSAHPPRPRWSGTTKVPARITNRSVLSHWTTTLISAAMIASIPRPAIHSRMTSRSLKLSFALSNELAIPSIVSSADRPASNLNTCQAPRGYQSGVLVEPILKKMRASQISLDNEGLCMCTLHQLGSQ